MARIGLFNGSLFNLSTRYKMMSTVFPATNMLKEKYRPKSTEIDVLDSFTARILGKRADKLKGNIKREREIESNGFQTFLENITNNSTLPKHQLDIRDFKECDLDSLIIVTINGDDFKMFDRIVEQLIKYQILPSENVILKVLSYLCKSSEDKSINLINDFITLAQQKNRTFYEENCELAPFVAQCLWHSGNYKDALNSLEQLYASGNAKIKAIVRQNYRILIKDAFLNKGNAITITVTAHAINVYKTHNDATVLLYVWCDTFTSDMFSDTQLANDLFSKYEDLRKSVSAEISRFSLFLLECHDIDAVHRLIEQVMEIYC